ncbi:4-hydroxyproline epimerase [Bowmanella dokdonensis]|uniref:4-hydroxyproline epimerase n=1 Tax=Bowmanella dokdonensis TaxID=751969 RepID=A0A939DN88_9ALTE|nr:4-hydroxyproline epimerase [Bowmanella dokdonensis]MBN7825235.1 4-hydroxyproline epimerase [Bowmanella dokdonensis]
MLTGTFFCVDAHTCGNPVRLVTSGHPPLMGNSMSEKRQDFIRRFDWIRQALMFEPRGHAMMSGAFLYPPCSEGSDGALLFIETSGALPMCGHGTIGAVTAALEQGLLKPRVEGRVYLDVPAGQIEVEYERQGHKITHVKIQNVPSFMAIADGVVNVPGLGEIRFDVAYGGNYYAIVDPQPNYPGLEHWSAAKLLHFSPMLREAANQAYQCTHPLDPSIQGISHVQWTGRARHKGSDSANAVFYGSGAIDRSPCGTGTSARMAQLYAKGKLRVGDSFVHESIIGSQFVGRIEALTNLAEKDAIVPSIQGWARTIGYNQILVDDGDPYAHGFEVN